jgi:SAM-dependent methyltransferase
MKFSNHFSETAKSYREFRPSYPKELFDFLATLTPKHHLAWDCATGNGQAAVSLAKHFDKVVATDASEKQIANAIKDPKVEYSVALAEETKLKSHSVDLITVAQALHWFRFDEFYSEVHRVAVPDGIIAVWAYGVLQCGDLGVDDAVNDFYWNLLAKDNYWPPERKYIDDNYTTIPFPFEVIAAPKIVMTASWTREGYLDYLRTWSAVQKYIERNGRDPVAELLSERVHASWKDGDTAREFRTELILKVGKVFPLR